MTEKRSIANCMLLRKDLTDILDEIEIAYCLF